MSRLTWVAAIPATDPPRTNRCASEATATTMLAEICCVSPYFAIGVGPLHKPGWRPVRQLYTDTRLLGAIVERVQARIGACERRVAASTFFFGFAARLWSIGIGALAGHALLPDLDADCLLFREDGGQIRLHVERPVAWQGDDLAPALADMVFESHLIPLTAALRQLGPIPEKLLRGNAASALLGAARVFDRHSPPGAGWQLARRLCADERLTETVIFNNFDYRRTSCCLYYRAAGGGLCGDCALTTKPGTRHRKEAP